MKTSSAFKLFLPLFIVVFAFTSCDMDDNPVGTFGEAVERVPEVQLIEGADNVTMKVQYDRDYSYFNVTLTNTGNSGIIPDGTYNSWCLQMELPMQTNHEYTGVKLYSTDRDKIINRLSYIINNRHNYEIRNPGLNWKDIQVAFWVILETKDMKLETIADILPSSVEGYNAQYVNDILKDVKSNGMNFKPGFGDSKIIMTDANDNDQANGIQRDCETAWGGDTGFNIMQPGQWWYLFDTKDEETQTLWAGQTNDIGTVTISGPDNGERTITIALIDGWVLDDDDESVKIQGLNEKPENTSNSPTPGLFTTYKGNELEVTVPVFEYYAIHLDVCRNKDND